MMFYRWTNNRKVFLTKSGKFIKGVETGDTCLGIKLKAQDQLGFPVSTLKLFAGKNNSVEVEHYFRDKDIDDNSNLCGTTCHDH